MTLKDQIRKGSTEILILALLADRPMYGYEITQQLNRRSGGYFDMKEGLLYPTLHRMKKAGWLQSELRKVGKARQRKYYTLTAEGREMLSQQSAEWKTFMAQMQQFMNSMGVGDEATAEG